MARTHTQILKQIETAKNFNPGKSITLLELEELRDQFRGSWFNAVLTAYNLGFLRGEAAQAKRKPR